METTLENVAVFITELNPLSLSKEFIATITNLTSQNIKNILVICDEIHPDVIKFAVMNMLKRNFNMAIVKKPMQKEYLEDIKTILSNSILSNNEKINYIIEKQNESLSNKISLIINEVVPKSQERNNIFIENCGIHSKF
jgi:chaperonin GroEL (HSP60 family)